MAFPANPTTGDCYYTHTQTWEWSGTAWGLVYDIDDSAILRVNPDEPTGVPAGVNAVLLAGIRLSVSSLAENDMLRYNNGAWRNTPQTNITDGGNF